MLFSLVALTWASHITQAQPPEIRREQFTAEGAVPLSLTFTFERRKAGHADRVIAATKDALRYFHEWLGPFPGGELAIVDAPWNRGEARTMRPGIVHVTIPWLVTGRDASLERSIICGIALRYWRPNSIEDTADWWFREGLIRYSSVRAMNAVLDRRHYYTAHYFGGFIPYTVRSQQLSRRLRDPKPVVRQFAELPASSAGGERAALALHTLERHIGWPALQQALAAFLARSRSQHVTAADFAAIVSEQRGHDMNWYFAEAWRTSARFDYGVDAFTSEPARTGAPSFQTSVRFRRFGNAAFMSLPVLIDFEDGTEINEWWDGREPQLDLEYVSEARALRASVDPNLVLLLDADRANNTRTLRPRLPAAGARAALNWFIWLQDLMLACTSLV